MGCKYLKRPLSNEATEAAGPDLYIKARRALCDASQQAGRHAEHPGSDKANVPTFVHMKGEFPDYTRCLPRDDIHREPVDAGKVPACH